MTSQTKLIFENYLEIMNQYILNPSTLPTNRSPKWVIKFAGVDGGVDIDAVKGAFNCYNCSFDFERDLNGQDTVGAGLKGKAAFILQNNPETPLMQILSENIFSNNVFETISIVRLMDSSEKNIQNVFIMSNAKISKLNNNNDLIFGEISFEQINVTDFKINDSGEQNGKLQSGYNFEKGEVK